MGRQTLSELIREKIGSVAWCVFLRANKTTDVEYWRKIAIQEIEYSPESFRAYITTRATHDRD